MLLETTKKMLNFGALTLTLAAMGSAFASPAHAELNPQGSDLGVMGGLAIVNNNVGTHLDLGATGHVQVLPNMNVGFYYQYYWNNISDIATTHNHTIAAEMNYLGSGTLTGFYGGAKVGLQLVGNSLPGSQSSTDLVFGPAVGYDYPLGGGLSVGGQANILWVTQSTWLTDVNLLGLLKLAF